MGDGLREQYDAVCSYLALNGRTPPSRSYPRDLPPAGGDPYPVPVPYPSRHHAGHTLCHDRESESADDRLLCDLCLCYPSSASDTAGYFCPCRHPCLCHAHGACHFRRRGPCADRDRAAGLGRRSGIYRRRGGSTRLVGRS